MNCAVHTDVAAAGYCRQCGKALCPACTREVGGALYCETCLTGIVSAAPSVQHKSGNHPGAALALGFIPGLGAVYNGEYVKALVHVAVFGGIIALLNLDLPSSYEAFLGIGLGCFYCYMPIDAYRTARARQSSETRLAEMAPQQKQTPMGAIVLIALGIIFLLANFGLLRREWLIKGWPIALVALGVWILMDRLKGNV